MPARVRDASHQTVEGVDLAHEMTLADPADRRIARHLADGLDPVGQQQGACADARGRGRGLAAGVSAADDDDIPGVVTDGLCGSTMERIGRPGR